MLSPKDTHDPIVKSGPTKGESRSRNQDGEWRKKEVMQDKAILIKQ